MGLCGRPIHHPKKVFGVLPVILARDAVVIGILREIAIAVVATLPFAEFVRRILILHGIRLHGVTCLAGRTQWRSAAQIVTRSSFGILSADGRRCGAVVRSSR